MLYSSARRALFCLVLPLLSCTAFATDYYVDVVNGNDANAGTSPASAWQTLTFASVNAAAGSAHTIHVAPGTYSAVSGETFPLQFRGQHVIGDSGPASTIVDGNGALYVVQVLNLPSMPVPASVATLSGLTLQGAGSCIDVTWTWSSVTTSFTDLILRNATTVGVGMTSSSFQGSGASFNVQLSRVRVEACQQGLFLSGNSGSNSVNATDCEFVNCNQNGVFLNVRTTVTTSFVRCAFRGNGAAGAHATVQAGPSTSFGFGFLTTSFSDCLFASNQSGWAPATSLNGTVASTLTRCTVANNAFGLITVNSGTSAPTYTLDSTLVWGNGTDYSAPNAPTTSFSQIGGADPLFRDPLNSDFRVNFGSPVIDAGDPATPVGTLDLNGVARSVDGDLDILERADIGCFEFQPLEIRTSGQVGTLLELEVFGSLGGSSLMRIGRGPLAGPVPTQFGEFDLNLTSNFPWLTLPTAPGPGFIMQRLLPTMPAFIGQTYSFQGLVTSSASSLGAAWSNAVSFTITP